MTRPVRPLPVIPTIIVLVAVGVMVALGVWQLGRAQEKSRMIAGYEKALALSAEVPFPANGTQDAVLYRRSRVACTQVLDRGAIAGRSIEDVQGWAQTVLCDTAVGKVEILLGWSLRPDTPSWEASEVVGLVVPAAEGVRLQALRPKAGLSPLAPPDPRALPNNHLAYAGQWFFFAFVALVIYLLALRKRWRER